MKKLTQENIKPGIWIRTSPEDREYDPDVICRVKSVSWHGDNNASNSIILEIFWDFEEGRIQVPPYESEALDIGLPVEEIGWHEVLDNQVIITELGKEFKDISGLSEREIIKEFI